MLSQHDILQQHAAQPVADYAEADSQYEFFALDALREPFDQFISESLDKGPFILHHPDLHLGNILVDDDLNIQGIVDWEFAHAVPLQLFTPPLWAARQEPGLDWLSLHFFTELCSAAEEDSRFERRVGEWYPEPKTNRAFYFARMMRHPAAVTEVFAKYFGRGFAKLEEEMADFFAQNPDAAVEAEQRASRNARWTQHLKDSGMYECDE